MTICVKCESDTVDFRIGRRKCRICEREEHRAWHHANREALLPVLRARSKDYYRRHKSAMIAKANAYNVKNKDKRRGYCKKNLQKQRKEVSALYSKKCLAESMGVSYKEVPPALVAVHQQYIQLRRLLNERL